ncbi:putative LRR receptor-like serine/threonine-protein kinase [Acorus gramineus]|uniref:non-specific serine/threonine protein kinase n=1 Tax=Acorus gramineus TaxID=55184 RepID=A0AAV9BM65_ACOGR|nr:putative LRR receptor-like serine/threonine-protein kinase [Acorus gramineus]
MESGIWKISDLSGGSSSSLDFIRDMKNLSTLILRNNRISGGIPPNMNEYQNLQLFKPMFGYRIGAGINGDKMEYPQILFGKGGINENLNLVANNFVIDDSNGSGLPSGLFCLQRSMPCLRDTPFYSFAINCGGKTIQGSDGTLFDSETENLGAASYYVTDTKRWAVSNVGTYSNSPNETFVLYNLAHFDNTLDSELFQSARQSPSSLRYYGLGLQKGNYTVSLQFAELLFDNPPWTINGRRVFDIYIQGNRVEKDFDIQKEAGRTFRAVKKDFIASVSNTVLEIHFFWAGKGTYSVPHSGEYGPLISVISATPQDFKGTGPNLPPSTHLAKKAKARLVAGIIIPIGIVALVLIFGTILWRRKQRMLREAEDEELLGTGARPNTFSYAELRISTEDFSDSNKLGEGGFGRVYKGKLADGREVAVKQLSVASHQGKSQFVTEIATISAVQHRNLVKLYGCCIEGERRVLVYDGYLAPEYALWGHLTEKVDVFGFGVVALEIITGRKNCDVSLDEGKAYLLEWAWQLHEENNDLGLVDMTLTEFNAEEAIRVVGVALLCTQASPTLRPSMSKVVAMLSGDVGVVSSTTRPNYWNECGLNDMLSFASNGMSGYAMGMMTSSTMTPTTSSKWVEEAWVEISDRP